MRSFNLSLGEEYSNQLVRSLPRALNKEYEGWANFALSYTNDDRGRAMLGMVGRSREGNPILDGMIGDMKRSCGQILRYAANFVDVVPAAQYDVKNIGELEEVVFKPIIDFIADELPKRDEVRGRKILYREEVAFIVERLSRLYHLQSYILGRSQLHSALSNGTTDDLTDAIGPFHGYTKAFYVKWKGKFNCRYGKVGKKQLGIIVYYVVDSNNVRRQILPWAIKTKRPERLIEKNPQSGIDKVIISDEELRRKSEGMINEMLQNRQQRRLTPSQLLRLRSSRRKYGRYLKVVYPNGKPTKDKKIEEERITYIS